MNKQDSASVPCCPLSLRWRHYERDGVSNHQSHDCLFNRLFRHRSKKMSKFRVTGLCEGNSPGTGEFPAQRASNAENTSIWWRHHVVKENVPTRCTRSNKLKIHSLISPSWEISIYQMCRLVTINHSHIRQMSLQHSCDCTCPIWKW